MDARRIPFTEEDERRIASAATWGVIVAVSSLATGVISLLVQMQALSSLPPGLSRLGSGFFVKGALGASLVQAVIVVLINVWLLQASLSFRKVALTDEADQAHLLTGFRRLRAYFMVQVVLLMLLVGLVLFGVVVGLSS
ncbi:hypothetical protein [Paraliomyxa miuraensis]|uniref:hypothetical protein n=1 Tax=Paraliomyxa miuraensis TaxID=376150 RepID=UPI00225893AB|nr:hypothetical protein [Paraliomyxa miuraensis]MCX4243956.1 hypothetical protein [Paraliomyxa miuraensis]